jgi:hypothetical protein
LKVKALTVPNVFSRLMTISLWALKSKTYVLKSARAVPFEELAVPEALRELHTVSEQ